MGKLLRKELKLAMHPTAILFLFLSAMLLIPNYPYCVVFFYSSLGVFFICMTGRENHDIEYSMMLPIAKTDIVKARILTVVLLQMAQLVIAIPCAVLRQSFPMPGNEVGMDANIALFGFGLIMFALFNLVFFSSYYRNVDKVGAAFLKASTVIGIYACAEETLTHAVPFFRDKLDTSDPQFLKEKLLVLFIGILIYLVCTLGVMKKSERNFEKLDL